MFCLDSRLNRLQKRLDMLSVISIIVSVVPDSNYHNLSCTFQPSVWELHNYFLVILFAKQRRTQGGGSGGLSPPPPPPKRVHEKKGQQEERKKGEREGGEKLQMFLLSAKIILL